MKNIIKILVGSIALSFGGISSAAVASNVINNQATVEKVQSDDNHNLIINNSKYFVTKNPAASTTGFNFVEMLTEGIQRGGANLIGAAVGGLGSVAFNSLLSGMGIDMRSNEEKQLDKISTQLDVIQKDLKQGISDIKRRVTQIRNENIMNDLLTKFATIQTPVAGKMATMIDIGKKELNDKYDKKELDKEKETFYQGLSDMKFDKLNGNNLWSETENLAKTVLTPYLANVSINLDDLYEETYGTIETWDYMTIAPRTKFIGYIGSLVNSLAQLANLKASYDMSKLKEGDSNLLDYKVGVNSMIKAVNDMNGAFKTKLEKLAAIQKKHDEQHLITHRERVIDKDGNLTIKDGRTVSSKLYAVTPGDNDRNLIAYDHDDKNYINGYYGGGYGACVPNYVNYIYTLDCTSNKDLYQAIFNEYNDYKAVVDNKLTMKDYLYKVGFSCDDKDLFDKAKGFYSRIDDNTYTGSEDNFWKTDKHNELRVRYYDFNNTKFEESASAYSDTRLFKNGWFSDYNYSGRKTDNFDNYYLVLVNEDQKTIEGKIVKTEVEHSLRREDEHGNYYNHHYRGHKKWTAGDNTKVVIK